MKETTMSAAVVSIVSSLQAARIVAAPSKPPHLTRCATACSTCALRTVCLPSPASRDEAQLMDELVSARKRVKRGEHVFRANDHFTNLFVIRTGFFKSYVESEDGRTQVTRFLMPGELCGTDGIDNGRHRQSVVALEDGEVCMIPYARLEALCARVPAMQHHLFRIMSSEIVRDQALMMLLGTMRAEARVAAFLLRLSHRFAARGYSAIEFNLRMTREEIGSYLGLKLETVSRIFSRLHEDGVVLVQGRALKLIDLAALNDLAGERAVPVNNARRADDLYTTRSLRQAGASAQHAEAAVA
jgi:CRP/FNR family transcriptional regulator